LTPRKRYNRTTSGGYTTRLSGYRSAKPQISQTKLSGDAQARSVLEKKTSRQFFKLLDEGLMNRHHVLGFTGFMNHATKDNGSFAVRAVLL
jgi:hypothetical protein